jgi:hypothetical protein
MPLLGVDFLCNGTKEIQPLLAPSIVNMTDLSATKSDEYRLGRGYVAASRYSFLPRDMTESS